MSPGGPFAGKAPFFASHYRTGRGRIRLELVMERLLRHLPPPPARVLDAGGGTGAFAIPLARLGFDVTILDPSPDWLRAAEEAASAQRTAIRCVEGRAEEAERLAPGPFDAVVCHTVLIYAGEPAEVLGALRRVARPRAVLSSLEKNRDALAVRPAREGDWAEALRVLDDPVASGRLGIPNRALRVGELRGLMLRTGWVPERWGGIRVYADGLPDDADEGAQRTALDLDRTASTREPHRRFGRLVHVLARAWEPEPLGTVQARSFAGAQPGTLESWPPSQALDGTAIEAFLDAKRYGVLSTTRPDGRPHATMIAYCISEGRVWLPAVAMAQRVRNVRHEPSASLLVTEGEGDRHRVIVIEGPAAVHENPQPLLDGWLRKAWRERHGSDLSWAGAVIELVPTRVLSHGAGTA